MKNILILIVLLSVSFDVMAKDVKNKLVFPKLGFSIDALEGDAKSANYTVFSMSLPPSESFAPNVNLMIQEYSGSLQEYKELSDGQFKSMKLNVVTSDIKGGNYIMEYAGNISNKSLHFYAKAVKKGSLIYLATATATPNQWKEYALILKKNVNSFELN